MGNSPPLNPNRLTSVSEGDFEESYTYYPDGRRMTKTSNGVTTTYVWDGDDIVLEVTGDKTTKYVYGLNLIAQCGSSVQLYYLYDSHGNVVKTTDSVGAEVQSYEYDAFGNQLDPDTGDTNPFRYCGEYVDLSSGLIYLRARYYDPSIGRFINEDPVQDGINWYIYCWNNPVMYKDSTGYYKEGDENLPYEIQLILNGYDGKTGGLTKAWNIANERNDFRSKNRIALEADELRKFNVTNIDRVVPLVFTPAAGYEDEDNFYFSAGHTATLLINEDEQGLLLSYYPENMKLVDTGEMRIAMLPANYWHDVTKGVKFAHFAASTGKRRSEKYNGSLFMNVSHENGRNALKKMAELFNDPGEYNLALHNCDHQTAAIVGAADLFYDKRIMPNESFMYTTLYHTNYSSWVLHTGV